jgi:hypothetical protein
MLPLGMALIIIGGIFTIGFIVFGPPLVLAGILLMLLDRLWLHPSSLVPVLIGGTAGLIAWYCLLAVASGWADIVMGVGIWTLVATRARYSTSTP